MPRSKQDVMVNRSKTTKAFRPSLTPEADEQQMISMATDLAKRQLLDGTASSQVITHFLVLASSKKKQESEIMELQKELLKAKTESLRSSRNVEELYNKAIRAMRVYSGNEESDGNNEEY